MRTITMYDVLRQLDRRRFLGFSIWEFSLRSLPRLYGRIFLRDIVLRHPIRTLNGMLAYRRFDQGGRCEGDITYLYDGTETDLREGIVETDGDFLVALGFCQKPLGAPGLGCPAGRFNHDCHTLASDPTPGNADRANRLPIPCRDCDVRAIGLAALQAGAVVYIMTSAADIAHHLFIPTLENRRFRYGLFLQCAYSIPTMVLPLLICRIQSLLVGYGTGDCRDYAQFLRADEGTKDERTHLNPTARARVLDLLHDVASVRRARGQHGYRVRREGPLYVPAGRL
jgi:hypothetical protein